jgi:PAS domain S-box-containing protein
VRSSAPLLGAALASFPEAILLLDTSDRIWWGNRAAAALTGWPEAAFRGMPLEALIPPPEIRAIAAARGVQDLDLRRYHCTLRTASGEPREVSVAVGPGADGVRLLMLRDIRRQREMERRLVARIEERQEVERRGREASGAVHDLRNLVNLLGATVKNLRRHRGDPECSEEGLRTLEEISGQAAHVLARVTAAPAGVAARPTTLDDLVRRSLALLGRAGYAEDVAATVVHGVDPSLECRVDAPEMLRVVVNVLLNAFDATRPVRGRVTVRGEAAPDGDSVRLVVDDTGPGFAPDYLAHGIFRPFRSTKPEGLGIGLYHARSIVLAHGGAIEAGHRPGGGARVVITLPAPPPGLAVERADGEAS